jgi:hypothetical protein
MIGEESVSISDRARTVPVTIIVPAYNESASVKNELRLSVDLSRVVQWRVEAEAYSAPFASVGVITAPNWRYISVSMGLLVRIAPK